MIALTIGSGAALIAWSARSVAVKFPAAGLLVAAVASAGGLLAVAVVLIPFGVTAVVLGLRCHRLTPGPALMGAPPVEVIEVSGTVLDAPERKRKWAWVRT